MRNLIFALSISVAGLPGVLLAAEATPAGEADIYSMSAAQLALLPADRLSVEIKKLSDRAKQNCINLVKAQQYNLRLCTALKDLATACPAQTLIMVDNGIDDLGCTGEVLTAAAPSIVVEILDGKGASFRLVANDNYVTDVFSGDRSTVAFTKAIGPQNVQAPRFRDLTSLNLIAVNLDSKIVNGVISGQEARPEAIKVRISVNNSPLLAGDGDGWVDPQLPDETSNKSTYRIDPKAILLLGTSAACIKTAGQLDQLQPSDADVASLIKGC